MQAKRWFGAVAITLLFACGGDRSRNKADNMYVPAGPSEAEPITDQDMAEINAGERKEFDEMMGKRVLDRGARKVKNCAAAGAAATEGDVTVVFDGEKGKVVDVELGYNFDDGNEQGKSCIKQSWIGEYVPPFDGNKKMTITISIPEKEEPEEKK